MVKLGNYKIFLSAVICTLITASLLVSSNVYAVGSSGFELATNSARSLAKANAVVADPDEPATIAFNPAGLTKLEGNQVSTSSSFIALSTSYDGKNGGVSEDSATHIATVPSTFISLSTPIKDFKVGLGVNAPFGLMTQYSSTGNFKYTANFNEIKTIGYNVAGAYQLTPMVSVGVGWTYLDTSLKQVGKLNSNFITSTVIPGTTGLADAPFELDVNGQGTGWNLGLLLTPDDKNSIGVFYRSRIRASYRGEVSVDTLQGAVMQGVFGGSSFKTSADTDITFPDNVTIGYNHKMNDRWDVEADLGWTNWSVFDKVDILFGTTNSVLNGLEPVNEDFRDVFSLQLGTSYSLNKEWTLNGGYFFYERAANKANYSNAIPDGDRHSLAIGLEYNTKSYSLDLAYIFSIFPSESINNNVGSASGAVVDGDYQSFGHIFSIGVTHKF